MALDKRVVKTRKAIADALMMLALEKDISKITVSDIADRAVINRSTFYLHYGDVKGVMDDIQKDIADIVGHSLSRFDINDIQGSTLSVYMSLANALDQNLAFKNFMLYSASSGSVVTNLKKTFTQKAMQTELIQNAKHDKGTLAIALAFLISGVIDSYIKWATELSDDMSLEDFCMDVSGLTRSIINHLKQH